MKEGGINKNEVANDDEDEQQQEEAADADDDEESTKQEEIMTNENDKEDLHDLLKSYRQIINNHHRGRSSSTTTKTTSSSFFDMDNYSSDDDNPAAEQLTPAEFDAIQNHSIAMMEEEEEELLEDYDDDEEERENDKSSLLTSSSILQKPHPPPPRVTITISADDTIQTDETATNNHRIPTFVHPTFSIWKTKIVACLVAILNPPEPPHDSNIPVFEGSKVTKVMYSQSLRDLLDKYHITSGEAEKDFLEFHNNCCSNYFNNRLPMEETLRKETANGTKIYYRSTMNKYLPSSSLNGVFEFHICFNGCTVYEGDQANATNCAICNEPRFFPCTRCHSKPNCSHSINTRMPRKVLRYKAITPVIVKLIQQPGFFTVFNHYNEDRIKGQTRDNPDCKNYVHAMKFMKKKFKNKYPDNNRRKNITFVPLCFSISYDGAQVYTYNISTFKPLFISVQNLPPTFRNKVGVGMFLCSAFTSVEGSKAEQFLFTDCLIRELSVLREGVEIEIYGKTYFICAYLNKHIVDTSELESYVNVSCSSSNMGCMFCGGIHGVWRDQLDKCTYNGHRRYLPLNHYFRAFGQSRTCCDKEYYFERACFKPIKKVQSPVKSSSEEKEQKQAQEENNGAKPNKSTKKHQLQPITTKAVAKTKTTLFAKVVPFCMADKEYASLTLAQNKLFLAHIYNQHYRTKEDEGLVVNEVTNFDIVEQNDFMETIDWALKFPNAIWEDEKAMMEFYHENMTFEEIRDYAYFHHLDYRAYLEYKRVHQETYMKYASEGKLSFNAVWYFHLLVYPRIDYHICYDPMHDAKNISHSVIDNLFGDRVKAKSASYCESIRTHPSLYQELADPSTISSCIIEDVEEFKQDGPKQYKEVIQESSLLKTKALYTVTKVEWIKADAFLNAIIRPSGYSRDYEVRFVFQRTGMMKTDMLLKWIINLVDFTMSAFPNMPEAYKNFHSRLSFDFSEMYSPVIISEEWIDQTFKLYNETLVNFECYYPEYESKLTWHHLLCDIQHMKNAGPFLLWWAFGGERGNSVVKDFVPVCGANPDKVFYNRYCRFEDRQREKAYNFDPEKLEEILYTHPIFSSDYCYSWDTDSDGNRRLLYSDERTLLRRQIYFKRGDRLSEEEYEGMLETIYINIKKRCETFAECLHSSSFFRMYWYFLLCRDRKLFHMSSGRNSSSFHSFTKRLVHIINNYHITNNPDDLKPFVTYVGEVDSWQTYQTVHNLSKEGFVNLLEGRKPLIGDDFEMLKEISQGTLSYRMFERATIFGMHFKSRGCECREKTKATQMWDYRWGAERNVAKLNDPDRYWPDNKKNELKHNWLQKPHYSSWAKIRYSDIDYHLNSKDRTCGSEEYEDHHQYLYGQFNFFMQIYTTADPFINNLTLASITCRRHASVERVDYILADHDGDSFFVHKMFVVLNDVYSTPIMICAFKSLVTRKRVPRKEQRQPPQPADDEDEAVDNNDTENRKRKRYPRNLLSAEGHNDNNHNETFETQICRTVKELKQVAYPYYVFNNAHIQKAYKRFAKVEDSSSVSYIVMLEMYRNRKYIRYVHQKDKLYRSNVFEIESNKCCTIQESCSSFL
jgi:hypothetical protein